MIGGLFVRPAWALTTNFSGLNVDEFVICFNAIYYNYKKPSKRLSYING
jgi:hypothetical protein